MSETPSSRDAPKGDAEGQEQEPAFTQADVDRIVRERVKREREKYADYDDLKSKAETAKSAEERIADLEREIREARVKEQRAKLVADVAKAHKITDPDDIALFLTGADEETLTAQAKRLAERDGERRRKGDVVPDAGKTPDDNAKGDPEMREYANRLFDSNKE